MYTTIEKVIFLQNVDVFSEVPTEQLAYVAAIAEEVSYLKNDDIYETNHPSDALYLVLEGKVKLHRDGEEITTAGAKEAFGTWALFDDEPRVTTASAVEDSRLLRIDREVDPHARQVGECIENSIDIRRDMADEVDEIVCGSGNDRQGLAWHDTGQAEGQLGAANAAGQSDDMIAVGG